MQQTVDVDVKVTVVAECHLVSGSSYCSAAAAADSVAATAVETAVAETTVVSGLSCSLYSAVDVAAETIVDAETAVDVDANS